MIKNYSFHVELNKAALRENQVFWQQARDMNALWDGLLEFRVKFLDDLAPLYEDKAANKEALKTAWKGFDKALYQITSEPRFKDVLGWLGREAVLESFKSAHKRAIKTGGKLRFKGSRIKSVSFYQRFSEGGLDTQRIFVNKSKKLRLAPVDENLYLSNSHQNRKGRIARGIFGIGKTNQPLGISVLLHREIPAGKLKTVRLKGELNEISREWSWKLVFAVESEDVPPASKYAPLAALDLNWRRIGDYLRIGYLTDTANNSFEIRLPLDAPPNAKARSLLKLINRGRGKENLPPLEMSELFPRTLAELIEWDETVGSLQQAAKDNIKTLYETLAADGTDIGDAARQFLTYFQRIRRRGLLELFRQLSENENPAAAELEITELLRVWKAEDYRRRLAINQTYRKLADKRKTTYENIALWLKTNYSHLAWEGDLSLKAIAELAPKISLNSKDVAIKIGNKYRQFAGLSVLRNKLKEHDTGKEWLININSAFTTQVCHICGADGDVTAKISVQCANGHIVDVDANSVENMLMQCPDDLIFSSKKETLSVPEQLKPYIVPVIGI